MNQGFDVVHGALFGRRRGLRMRRLVRPLGHVVQALFDNAQALADFIDAHPGAVVAVAVAVHRHVEIKTLVSAVGAIPAHIEVHARGAQARPGDAPVQGFFAGVDADALGALFEDAVVHGHLFEVIEARGHPVHKIFDHGLPALGQVLGDATNPKPGGVHTPAGNRLDNPQQPFAV